MNRYLPALLPAAAMSLGWGVRGQFGHETGAMVPGALVGFALAVLSKADTFTALCLGAAGALGTSIGGVETYGQTVGLAHDVPHSPHYWWGMLGLAVKGAAWIGFAGAFLGMARDARRYHALEIAGLMLALLALWWLGVRVLNSPHEPPDRLPLIYFSKRFDPKPRPEVWGGLWFALIGLLLYLRFIRRDRFAAGMGVCGILAGAIGFSGGEALQAASIHSHPFGEYLNQWIDWW
jgi:hypothetical protein